MPAKVRIAELSWRSVEAVIHQGAAVLVPMASTEEHGPFPTGDFLITDTITERVAKATGDVMTPVIPFAYSEYFRHYPGTLTLQADTFRHLVHDLVSGLLDQGFRHVILVNGHGGNDPILQILIRQLRRERGILVASLNANHFGLTSELQQELYGDRLTGHGGESTGSEYAFIRPDLIDPAQVGDWGAKAFMGMPASPSGIEFQGQRVSLALNMEDVSVSSGSIADPRGASAEKGKRIIDNATEGIAEFVRWFKTIDTTIAP